MLFTKVILFLFFGAQSIVKFEPALVDIFFVTLCFCFLYFFYNKKIRLFKLDIGLFWLYAIFIFFSYIAVQWSDQYFASFSYVLKTIYLLSYLIVIPPLIGLLSRNLNDYYAALYVSFFLHIILVLYFEVYQKREFSTGLSVYRYVGFFKDPNVAAPYSVIFILITLKNIININSSSSFLSNLISSKILRSIFLYCILFISLIFVFLCFSRGAYLNLLVSFFIFVVLSRKFYLSVLPFIVFISFLFIKGTDLWNFFQSRLKFMYYDSGRFSSQKLSFEYLFDNLFPIGPGRFGKFAKIFYLHDTHSLYLNIIVENGILPFISYFSIICIILICLFKVLLGKLVLKDDAILIFSLIWGVLAQSFFVGSSHWRHFYILLAFGIFIINKSYNSNQERIN